MPHRASHPDREELAEFQAALARDRGGAARARGQRDDPRDAAWARRRQELEAHLAGCGECREVVDALDEVGRRLAALPEPEASPAFSLRLAGAVEREAERLAPRRRPAWARATGWMAAAAALLVVIGLAGLVSLLGRGGGHPRATSALQEGTRAAPAAGSHAAGGTGGAAAAPQTAALPVFNRSGDYSASRLVHDLSTDAAMRGAARGSAAAPGVVSGAPKAGADSSQAPLERTPQRPPGTLPTAQQAACLAQLRQRAAGQPQRPAFFITARYHGQPATLVVTVTSEAPQRARLWVFPNGNCTQPPTAFEQVPLTAP